MDKTYCSFYETCVRGAVCEYKVTPEMSQAAAANGTWVTTYVAPPYCHATVEPEDADG